MRIEEQMRHKKACTQDKKRVTPATLPHQYKLYLKKKKDYHVCAGLKKIISAQSSSGNAFHKNSTQIRLKDTEVTAHSDQPGVEKGTRPVC